MKKSVLILGLCAVALQASAQSNTRWDMLNTDPITTPFFNAGIAIDHVHAVNPNVMWSTAYDSTPTPVGSTNTYVMYDATAAPANRLVVGAIFSPTPGQGGLVAGNIHGITNNIAVAAMYPPAGAGGEILRTTNGSVSGVWTKRTSSTQFSNADSFLNFVHMFNALEGVAVGDPISVGGVFSYEVVRTTDGGLTWNSTGVTAPTRAIAGEYGFVRSYYGNSTDIWFIGGTPSSPDGVTPGTGGRVFRSTNKGLTWTVGSMPAGFVGVPTNIAFRDNLNGICFRLSLGATAPNPAGTNRINGMNMARTSDGGATWTNVTPNRGINTPGNRFYFQGLDVARTSATQSVYISYGNSKFGADSTGTAQGSNFTTDFGYSYSTDGVTWTGVQRRMPVISMDLLDTPGVIDATTGHGFAGYFTGVTTTGAATTAATGGIYRTKFNATTPLVRGALDVRNGQLSALNVYPNPSASGVFQLALDATIQAGTQLTVTDVLGRAVYSRELNATSVNAKSVSLDLSNEKAGVYLLSLRSDKGVASQKLVIE